MNETEETGCEGDLKAERDRARAEVETIRALFLAAKSDHAFALKCVMDKTEEVRGDLDRIMNTKFFQASVKWNFVPDHLRVRIIGAALAVLTDEMARCEDSVKNEELPLVVREVHNEYARAIETGYEVFMRLVEPTE